MPISSLFLPVLPIFTLTMVSAASLCVCVCVCILTCVCVCAGRRRARVPHPRHHREGQAQMRRRVAEIRGATHCCTHSLTHCSTPPVLHLCSAVITCRACFCICVRRSLSCSSLAHSLTHSPLYCACAAVQACAARIKGNADADCESWYFDYYKCLDKWVSSVCVCVCVCVAVFGVWSNAVCHSTVTSLSAAPRFSRSSSKPLGE
jgi:hypothetical protein